MTGIGVLLAVLVVVHLLAGGPGSLLPGRQVEAAKNVREMMDKAKAQAGPAFVASFSSASWEESRHVFPRRCVRCDERYWPPMDGPDTHRCSRSVTIH